MNNTIPILLATSGKFDINTNYLPYINPMEIRYNKTVIDYFNLYGNIIAKNCTLKIDKIPREIFHSKKIIIRTNSDGSEIINLYESDGDVFMRNF